MRGLVLATVTKSLAFQAPTMWPILASRGYDLTFAASPDQHADVLSDVGTVHPLPLDRGLTRGTAKGVHQLRQLLDEHWDLVQVQTPVAAGAARLSRRRHPRSLYVAHGLHATRDLPRHRSAGFLAAEHALAGRTSAIAVVCQEDFDLARRMSWGRRALVWRLPGAGVRTDTFEHPSPGSRTPRHALFVGELNANKQITTAVAVADLLVKDGLVEKLVVIGDGPLRGALQEGQDQGWIEHHPFRADVHLFYRDAAVLLHTSVREGLPRVIIEAQAAGVPVLARSNRGSRELVVAGTGALLGRAATPREWVEAFRSLDTDRSAMQDNAARYDVATFDASYSALIGRLEAGTTRGYVDLDDQPR